MSNVGSIDRIARLVVELALIAYAIPTGWTGWIGVVLTAVFAYCPAYSPSTCSARQQSRGGLRPWWLDSKEPERAPCRQESGSC